MTRENITPEELTGYRVTWIGVGLNLILAGLKLFVGHFSHSRALVADGVHSLSDLISDGLVLLGLRISNQPSDADHPYGHGKFENLASLGVAIILGLVAAGILMDGLRSIFLDKPTIPGFWALVIAFISLVVKEYLYRITATAAAACRSDALLANAWHHRSDALSSLAVFAGLIGTRLGLPILDAVAAAGVSVAVGYAAWSIGRDALHKLTDKALAAHEIEELRQLALQVEGIQDIHHLRSRWMGNKLLLDLHALVGMDISVSEGHHLSELLRLQLMAEKSELADVVVHVEPEDHGEGYQPGPGFDEVENRLNSILGEESTICNWRIEAVHYLGKTAKVDLCLFMPGEFTLQQAELISTRLKEKVTNLDQVTLGRIWFNSA